MTKTLWSGWVWAAATPLLALGSAIATALAPLSENDLYLHVLLGQEILANNRTTGNPNWVFTATNETWNTTTPLIEILYAHIDNLGAPAWAALHVLAAIAYVLLVAWGLAKTLPRTLTPGPARIATLTLTFLSIGMIGYLGQRPQTLAILALIPISVWTVRIIHTGKLGTPKTGILLTLLIWAWTWLHGSSLAALAFLAFAYLAYTLANTRNLTQLKNTLSTPAWLALAALATLLTPAGTETWTRSLNLINTLNGLVDEWSPPTILTITWWTSLTFLALWIWGFLKTCTENKRNITAEIITLLLLFLTTYNQTRLLLLALTPIAFIASYRAAQALVETRTYPWETWNPKNKKTLAILTGVALLFVTVYASTTATWHQERTPITIWNALNEQPGTRNLIVNYEYGSQALYYTEPGKIAVSSDARLDLYSTQQLNDQQAILDGAPNWRTLLNNYPTATDILAKTDSPLITLATAQGWTVTAQEGNFTLLSKN